MDTIRRVESYMSFIQLEEDFETDCREWRTWRLYKVTGQDLFFSCPLYFFPHSFSSSYFLPLFHCLISILLFPCTSVWENTLAWVPNFLLPYWMELVLFGHQYSFVVTCLLSKTKLNKQSNKQQLRVGIDRGLLLIIVISLHASKVG